jgi:8-oxo-dGTP pyrophosphatase MutT (NUDIX family)
VQWRYRSYDGDPDLIARVRLFLFEGDRILIVRFAAGWATPGGGLGIGEHWINAAIREAREEAGASVHALHPFGILECTSLRDDPFAEHLPHPLFNQVVAWGEAVRDGEPTNPEGEDRTLEVVAMNHQDAAALIESNGYPEFAELVIEAARLRALGVSDHVWFRDNTRLLENLYLRSDDPAMQSGKGGGMESWSVSRRIIADAVDGDGDFLDVGCANGLLMESVHRWCAEDGHVVEPYGLDISAGLGDLARRRLPRWADRIWTGNAWTWTPQQKFRYVHTRLEYVPEHHRAEFVQRQLGWVEPGGRLLITVASLDELQAAGIKADGSLVRDRPAKRPVYVAWLNS